MPPESCKTGKTQSSLQNKGWRLNLEVARALATNIRRMYLIKPRRFCGIVWHRLLWD
jgi:hypothetical protein